MISSVDALIATDYEQLLREFPEAQDVFADHERMVAERLCEVASANCEKNRYSNIFPFDTNLVHLNNKEYINASWVTFPNLARRYILAAAPMHPKYHGPDTCPDWWCMIYEQRVTCVVMLVTVEKGFSGSARYWPKCTDESMIFGDFSVKLLKEESIPESDCMKRSILLCHRPSGDQRNIVHLQFCGWPNYGVPSELNEFSSFVKLVENEWADSGSLEDLKKQADVINRDSKGSATLFDGSTLVVHCSGGVGRSGSFTTIHSIFSEKLKNCNNEMNESDPVTFLNSCDILSHIRTLRKSRHPWAVEDR
eukprot:643881_1